MEEVTTALKPFFAPGSIAVIGASSDPEKPGGRALRALVNKGYAGRVYPVNPRHATIFGLPCYPSVTDIPGEVDLAVVSVPAAQVYNTLERCAQKGVRAAIIFSSGFAETGPEGKLWQAQITALARRTGMRVCGPNCLGIVNTESNVMASFAFIVDLADPPGEGPKTVGFVTQSGAFGALIYAQALAGGVGLKYFVSVGNEADLEFADFLRYMVHDRSIRVIGGYLEGAKDGWKLRRVAEEAAEAKKPILIMKAGRTSAGARAAASHTGSLAGEDRLYSGFFKQTGIIRIERPEELIAFVPLVTAGRLPKGRNIALVTTSGGAGVVLADMCEGLGLSVPRLGESTIAKMRTILPSFASAQNPVDLTAQYITNPEILLDSLKVLVEDEKVDIVLGNFDLREPYGVEVARRCMEIYRSTDKTIVVSPWILPGMAEGEGVKMLRQAGIPVIPDIFQAVRAIAHLADYADFLRKREGRKEKSPAPVPDGKCRIAELGHLAGPLGEARSKALLAGFGIPVTREALATGKEEAVSLAARIGYPVALKVDSPDIPHKTEAGALRLNLRSEGEVAEAYEEILRNARNYKPGARINGVLVQEMLPPGIEVIVGVTRDPAFGPAVMFGLGGIFVEVFKDVSFRVAPLSREDALEMIGETKGFQLLKGARGAPPADMEALAETIVRVSHLALELGDCLEELDINPLMVYPQGRGVKAADAMVVLRRESKWS
ncbi:acetate--CoA ligase family protein [Desulfovirgula thermocuniculi]|uniref:acetate--CoA ligase family protein n=1 Tax=Desulfovirgula thermocuniculi TaxID=348842 RepID=UPI0003F5EB7F|nr:acetate--CoA ligase [Desulfovirgula thermocuniculi]